VLNLFLHFIFYTLATIVPLSYGIIIKNIFLKNNNIEYNIGTLGFLGLFFLLFINLFFHNFLAINSFIIFFVLTIGIIIFLHQINEIRIYFSKIHIFVFLLIYPISIIFFLDEDFNYYYLPYLTYLQSTKIVFGLVNLNDALVSSQNTLYDIYVFFGIKDFIDKTYSIPGASFLFFFINILICQIKKFSIKEKIFFTFVLIISIVTFDKLRDIGAAIPAQLLMIICLLQVFMMLNSKIHINNLVLILFFFHFSFLLRINSIIIFPFIVLLIIYFYSDLFYLIKKFKLFISFNVLVFLLFLLKNLIISGCIIYPVYYSCFDKTLKWSASVDKSVIKLASYQSFSKGWMYYAREKLDISDKYIWKNIKEKKFKSVEEYSKTSIFFWLRYWFKDHDYKRILNLFLLNFIIFLIAYFSNYKNRRSFSHIFSQRSFLFDMKYILFFTSSLLSIFFWLIVSPQSRYGGFAIFIIFFSLFFQFLVITTINLKKINFNIFYILIFFAFSYSFSINLIRVNQDFFINKENTKFFPWPNYIQTFENVDYKTEIINDSKIYIRNKTKKLYNGDINSSEKYFLLCGDIPFPCMPKRNRICVDRIEVKNSYMYIYHNFDNNKCQDLFNSNMVF